MRFEPRERESGSATIWVLGALLALCALGALWTAGAQAGFARQRAEVAADLAAIAAAQALDADVGSPCAVAAAVAGRNGGRLASCQVDGQSVAIVVEVTRPTTARSSSRAGPRDTAAISDETPLAH